AVAAQGARVGGDAPAIVGADERPACEAEIRAGLATEVVAVAGLVGRGLPVPADGTVLGQARAARIVAAVYAVFAPAILRLPAIRGVPRAVGPADHQSVEAGAHLHAGGRILALAGPPLVDAPVTAAGKHTGLPAAVGKGVAVASTLVALLARLDDAVAAGRLLGTARSSLAARTADAPAAPAGGAVGSGGGIAPATGQGACEKEDAKRRHAHRNTPPCHETVEVFLAFTAPSRRAAGRPPEVRL